MIFAMKRAFRSGKLAKTPIVYLDAIDEKEAMSAFGAGGYWSGYHENTGFEAVPIETPPKKAIIRNAAKIIAAYDEEEKVRQRFWGEEEQ